MRDSRPLFLNKNTLKGHSDLSFWVFSVILKIVIRLCLQASVNILGRNFIYLLITATLIKFEEMSLSVCVNFECFSSRTSIGTNNLRFTHVKKKRGREEQKKEKNINLRESTETALACRADGWCHQNHLYRLCSSQASLGWAGWDASELTTRPFLWADSWLATEEAE